MSTPVDGFDPVACCAGGVEGQFNTTISDLVCGVVAGVSTTLIREVLFDAAGVQVDVRFISPNGTQLVPTSWVPGECLSGIADVVLCDRKPDGSLVGFLRKYVQSWSGANGAQVIEATDFTLTDPPTPYAVTGVVQSCVPRASDSEILCDSTPTRFLRTYVYASNGTVASFSDTTLAGAAFTPVGSVGTCSTAVTGGPVSVTGTITATNSGSVTSSTTLTTATTGNGTTVDFGNAKSNVSMFVQANGTVTSGVVDLQASQDGINWTRVAFSSAMATGVNQYLAISGGAFRWYRGVVSDPITGGGSVTATLMFA